MTRPHRLPLRLSVLLFVGAVCAADAPPAEPPAEATVSGSGLAELVLVEGDGASPTQPDDLVTVRYRGWTPGGVLFEEFGREAPVAVTLQNTLPGWQEALPRMREGEVRRLWIPRELAFGGLTGKPAGAVIYDVELVHVTPNPPPSYDRPPESAERSPTGVAWMVLREGEGDAPSNRAVVRYHLTSWTNTGTLIESTRILGRPRREAVPTALPGMREMLPQMHPGELRRIWLPAMFGYRPYTGKPTGPVVFEVELLDVVEPPPAE